MLADSDGSIKLVDYGYTVLLHVLYEKILPEGINNQSYFSLAPEILLRDSFDTRVDIWSVGCLIIELITGIQPYFQETSGSVAELREMFLKKCRYF